MGNYVFKEEEPRKKMLDHAKISSDLKTEIKYHIVLFAILMVFLAGVLWIGFEWEGVKLHTVLAACVYAAMVIFITCDMINRYLKIVRGKYIVEIDTVLEINRVVAGNLRRNGRRSTYYLHFRNNGKYNLRNLGILDYTEVLDTFYIVRYEKKFGIKAPEIVYSTKRYEWNEEKKD